MSTTDGSEVTEAPAAAQLESEMDAELTELRAKGPGPGHAVRNPVFQHEQAVGTATDAAVATTEAARVSGEMAAEADQERLAIEREVRSIEQSAPASGAASDAEAALAQAERDGDEAVSESLDSDVAADEVRHDEGTRFLHKHADADAALAEQTRALADEAVVGHDLADLDALETRVEADATQVVPPAD